MSALPPNAPAWAWPLHPFGKNSATNCHDAIARRPFPVDGNIHLSSDVTFTSTARLHRGRPFGVLIHQASGLQAKFGVGRHYYLPTAADVARAQRLCPDLDDPENPNWLVIGNKLRRSGYADLAKLTPPELLKLLDTTETPPPSTSAPPAGTRQSEGEKPDAQSAKQLLHGWRAIDEALGLSRSYPNMNYDERRRKLAYLNRRFGGPVRTGRKGSQPVVNRSELIAWWNSLEDQVHGQKARIRDKQATLQSRHLYGRTAEVAPDLGGSLKRRKSSSQT